MTIHLLVNSRDAIDAALQTGADCGLLLDVFIRATGKSSCEVNGSDEHVMLLVKALADSEV